ncbi:hypothetical protein C8Q70DRAFT_143902 [Cubamyces menziesii]|nr:hypothetical protein C8Q70DRAFT_143902 [Cubamyces menziesii]
MAIVRGAVTTHVRVLQALAPSVERSSRFRKFSPDLSRRPVLPRLYQVLPQVRPSAAPRTTLSSCSSCLFLTFTWQPLAYNIPSGPRPQAVHTPRFGLNLGLRNGLPHMSLCAHLLPLPHVGAGVVYYPSQALSQSHSRRPPDPSCSPRLRPFMSPLCPPHIHTAHARLSCWPLASAVLFPHCPAQGTGSAASNPNSRIQACAESGSAESCPGRSSVLPKAPPANREPQALSCEPRHARPSHSPGYIRHRPLPPLLTLSPDGLPPHLLASWPPMRLRGRADTRPASASPFSALCSTGTRLAPPGRHAHCSTSGLPLAPPCLFDVRLAVYTVHCIQYVWGAESARSLPTRAERP